MLHVVEEVQRVERLDVVYVFHSKDLHFGSRGVSFVVEDLLSVGDLQFERVGVSCSRRLAVRQFWWSTYIAQSKICIIDRLVQTRTRQYAFISEC